MKSKKANNKKGSSKLFLFLKIFVILATSVLICITTYFIYLTKQAEMAANNSYEEIDRNSSKRGEVVDAATDNVSVLFVGIDDSEKRGQGAETSRSDALILATLNNKNKTIKLLSIPRDSYVYIPHVGYKDKITHAHSYGGTYASVETIEELFDIPIDYYVRLNFNAFIDVVDALGGVEVEVPYDMVEKDENDFPTVQLQQGLQRLNGRETLALARTRKADSDLERGKRQQEILKAIILEAASVSAVTKYDDVIEAVGDNMRTNMTFNEMKSFVAYLSSGVPYIETLNLEGYDSWEGGYYFMLEEQSVTDMSTLLKSHLGLSPATYTQDSDESTHAEEEYSPTPSTSY